MIFSKPMFNIYTKNVQYLAIFVEYLHNTSPTFALYVCNIRTMFKQHLRNIHTIFLQYLQSICTICEQYLHNISIKFAKCICNTCTIFVYYSPNTGWSLLVDTKVFDEKRICQAAMLHIVDVFSPFDNNAPTSSNVS